MNDTPTTPPQPDAPKPADSAASAESAAANQRSAVPENLKPHCFKPGQSGNPKGRPKGVPNCNGELLSAIDRYKGGKEKGGGREKYFDDLLERALLEPTVQRKLMDKILQNATENGPLVQFNSYEDMLDRLNGEGPLDEEPEDEEAEE